MGARRIRRELRSIDMKASRLCNGALKVEERARRDARMMSIVKKGKLPFLPSVMSWLSAKCDKPSRLLTQDDVNHLIMK